MVTWRLSACREEKSTVRVSGATFSLSLSLSLASLLSPRIHEARQWNASVVLLWSVIGCSGDLSSLHSSVGREVSMNDRSQIKSDYPLNLRMSVSGGKETNEASLSNGE